MIAIAIDELLLVATCDDRRFFLFRCVHRKNATRVTNRAESKYRGRNTIGFRFSFGGRIESRDYSSRDTSIDSATIKGTRVDAVTRDDVSEFSDSKGGGEGRGGDKRDPLMKPFSWTEDLLRCLMGGSENRSFIAYGRSQISDVSTPYIRTIGHRSTIQPRT